MMGTCPARADWTTGEPALVITTCARCGDHWYLPRRHCPVCGSSQVQDVVAAGRGLCVALTVLHVTVDAGSGPLRMALIELDEGPVVLGRVHDEALAVGDRAAAQFRSDGRGGALVPSFARERAARGDATT